jgi:hypothetical protein
MDIASLGFSIDSSDAINATQNLQQMQQAAGQVDQKTGQMTTSLRAHQIALRDWRTDAQAFNGVLIQTNNALDDLMQRLDKTRAAIDGTAQSFTAFSTVQRQVEALGNSFDQTSTSLESYYRKANELGLSTTQTVQSLDRITEALTNQTAAGKAARQVITDLGVNLQGLTANNANDVLAQFAQKLGGYADTTQKLRSAQVVLGPNVDPDTLAQLSQPNYIPYDTRRQRQLQEQFDEQSADRTRNAAILNRQSDLTNQQYNDLSSTFNVESKRSAGNLFGFTGLSPDMIAQITKELGPNSDVAKYGPTSIVGQVALQQYLAAHPDSVAAYSARTIGGNVSYLRQNSYLGRVESYLQPTDSQLRSAAAQPTPGVFSGLGAFLPPASPQLAANRAEIAARQTRDTQTGDGSLLSWIEQQGLALGRNVQADLNLYTPLPAIQDTRPQIPDEQYLNDSNVAQTLRGYGFTGASDRLNLNQRAKELQKPGVQDMFAGVYGAQGGDLRYNAVLSDLQGRARDALNPNQGAQDQADRAAFLQNTPLAQRGTASSYLNFLQGAGIPTRGFTGPNGSPQQFLSSLDPRAAAGDPNSQGGTSGVVNGVDPATRDAFLKYQSTQDATQINASNEALQQQLDLQTKLQGAVTQGSAAMEDITTRTSAYNAALAAGKDVKVAAVDAENALEAAQAKRATTSATLIANLTRENDLNAAANQAQQDAGVDPVARATAGINSQITTTTDNAVRSGQVTQQGLTAYQAQLQRQQGVQAEGTLNNAVAGSSQDLATAKALEAAAADRASVQAKIASDTQIEAQYAKEVAQARVAANQDNGESLAYVQKQIEALKQLKSQIDAVNATKLVIQGNTDLGNQANLNIALAGMSPEQRRLAQQALPDLRTGGFVGAPGYSTQIQQQSLAQGADPTTALVVAQRESSLGTDPHMNQGAYTGVFQLQNGTPGSGTDSIDNQIKLGVARVVQDMQDAVRLNLPGGASIDNTYLVHQQGATGARALLSADPNANVVDALSSGANLSRASASAHISQNSGNPNGSVGDFLAVQHGLNQQAETTIGTATDDQLLQYWQIYNQPGGPSDPRITALPQAQQDRLAQTARVQQTGTTLSGVNALQTAQQQQAASMNTAMVAAQGPAAVDAAQRQNQVTSAVQSGSIAASQAPQLSSSLLLGDATKQLQDLNSQTFALKQNADAAQGLAKAYADGPAAVQAFQDSLKTAPIEAQIEKLKGASDQTSATMDATEKLTDALAKYKTTQDAANTAAANAKTAQATSGLNDQNFMTQQSLNVPFYATDNQKLEASAEAQKALYAKNNPNVSPDTLTGYNSAIDQQTNLKEQVSDANTLQNAYKSASNALTQGFENAIVSGANMHTTLATLTQDLEKIAINAAIEKPLENALSGAFGGAGGFFSNLFGSGAGSAAGAAVASAAGNIFFQGRQLRAFAGGGMIDRPTLFPMAAGGTGLAGEAGNGEALMPVRRLPNGDLGIQSSGSSGHTVMVTAPVTIQGGASTGGQKQGLDKTTAQMFQTQMEGIISTGVKNVLRNEMRQGGMLSGVSR